LFGNAVIDFSIPERFSTLPGQWVWRKRLAHFPIPPSQLF
jgi:hypothetical protein